MNSRTTTFVIFAAALVIVGIVAFYVGRSSHAPGHEPMGTMTSAGPATEAYMAAMKKMDVPMMAGIQDPDPDAAFVLGMIPHHQGAIDMANVVLQHGKDPQTKAWAEAIIANQQREIEEMKAWLKAHGR